MVVRELLSLIFTATSSLPFDFARCYRPDCTHTLIRDTNNSTIPASVTTIAPRAFSRATATELVIPDSVTTIGNYFIADSAYVTIRYEGTQTQWNAITKTSFWNYGNRGVALVFD